MLGQETLRELLASSASARGHRLEDLAAIADAGGDGGGGRAALVILRRFELGDYVRGTVEFVGRLDPRSREEWYRDFTRTRFLVGDPDRVSGRHGDLITWRSADVAWVSPAGERNALRTLSRLLTPLRTAAPPAAPRHYEGPLSEAGDRPGAGPEKDICLATLGRPLEEYLVHLNHSVSEGLVTGALSACDRVVVREVMSIERLPARREYVRVAVEGDRLRAAGFIAPVARMATRVLAGAGR
jgi:hypothetical protein